MKHTEKQIPSQCKNLISTSKAFQRHCFALSGGELPGLLSLKAQAQCLNQSGVQHCIVSMFKQYYIIFPFFHLAFSAPS